VRSIPKMDAKVKMVVPPQPTGGVGRAPWLDVSSRGTALAARAYVQ
jgi:hypothetical protein